jgi:hypothetical protein
MDSADRHIVQIFIAMGRILCQCPYCFELRLRPSDKAVMTFSEKRQVNRKPFARGSIWDISPGVVYPRNGR